MIFDPGEIVIAKFPFSSLNNIKRRPCLILATGDVQEDLVVAFITSIKIPDHYKYAVKISPLEKDFLITGLKVESFVRLDKIATLHQSIISGAIGKITDSLRKEINSKLKLLFDL